MFSCFHLFFSAIRHTYRCIKQNQACPPSTDCTAWTSDLPLQQLCLHQNSAEVKLLSAARWGWELQELCAAKPPFWTPARGKFTDEMWPRPRNAISSFHICEMDETRFLILQPWCQWEDVAALHQSTGVQSAHLTNDMLYSGLRMAIYSSTSPGSDCHSGFPLSKNAGINLNIKKCAERNLFRKDV